MMTTQSEFRTALLDPMRAAPAGLRNPDGAQATKRFDVYRNNVAASLTDALETAFPVVDKLVGKDFFRAMAGLYLRAHPPNDPLLMFYGAAMRHSYHAADATPITPDALAALAPDTLPLVTFGFAPSVFVIPSRYPIHSIWWANTHGGNIAKTAQAVLITRPEFDPAVDALTPAQATVTQSLMSGTQLGEALKHGGAGFDLGPLLDLLLSRNALISLKT